MRLLLFLLLFSIGAYAQERSYWLREMDKMCRPVVESLAKDSLKIKMPKRVSIRTDNRESRISVQYVEVLGRVLSGIGPWLALEEGDEEEKALRSQYRSWFLQGMANALDSTKKDYMRFDLAGQQLVDASFIAIGFVRAPKLWDLLPQRDRNRLVQAIRSTRQFKPGFSNWLLFSAMNEVFLAKFGYEYDSMRIDYALMQHEQWYVGDGMYKDGEFFAFDYYNSYVIHPYLATILGEMDSRTGAYKAMWERVKARNARYAIIQERTIGADGSFPPVGRSLIYRGAAFHHLADVAWRRALPEALRPAQVRGALTAMLKKTLEARSTYEEKWLTLGLYGEQPAIADVYNNQGSPYLASTAFLPLGLGPSDPFWAEPSADWTQLKVWRGDDVKHDPKIR
jgi:hypothetical protein